MSNYISIGRLSETLLLMTSIRTYNCRSFTEVDHLSVCYGINKKAAYDFAIQCKWISEEHGELHFTEHGLDVVNTFDGNEISSYLWMIVLFDYISECYPAWSYLIPYGRKEAFLFMTNDEKRCFVEAGLMDSFDDGVVDWWDRIAMLFRKEKQDSLEDIGREGERKTLVYEENRTGLKPHWESIDSNKVGYDILSYKDMTSSESILIEVKSSKKDVDDAKMIITRNEWDVASCGYNIQRYYFYLWLLGDVNRLAIIPATSIREHIPNDIGSGHWKTLEIPFRLFKHHFKETKE